MTITLEVRPGEVHGLIGPNGAGKTTFIDAVTGFVRSSGTIDLGKQHQPELASPAFASAIGATRAIADFNRAYWRMLLRMYGWKRAA